MQCSQSKENHSDTLHVDQLLSPICFIIGSMTKGHLRIWHWSNPFLGRSIEWVSSSFAFPAAVGFENGTPKGGHALLCRSGGPGCYGWALDMDFRSSNLGSTSDGSWYTESIVNMGDALAFMKWERENEGGKVGVFGELSWWAAEFMEKVKNEECMMERC